MARKRKKGRMLRGTVSASSPLDQRVARGMAHPLRCQILAYLTEHPVSSPAEMFRAGVGKKDGNELSHISYHTRVLHELALVEEVKNRPVRGAIEHFYRAVNRMFRMSMRGGSSRKRSERRSASAPLRKPSREPRRR